MPKLNLTIAIKTAMIYNAVKQNLPYFPTGFLVFQGPLPALLSGAKGPFSQKLSDKFPILPHFIRDVL